MPRQLTRVRSSLGRILLGVALLAGWHAALEHPLRHVDELGELVHLHHGGAHHDEQPGGSEGAGLCEALAALTACAADAPQPLAGCTACEGPLASRNQGAPRPRDAPPFLSQGPPAFA